MPKEELSRRIGELSGSVEALVRSTDRMEARLDAITESSARTRQEVSSHVTEDVRQFDAVWEVLNRRSNRTWSVVLEVVKLILALIAGAVAAWLSRGGHS